MLKASLKSAAYSALSQSSKLDAAVVAMVNLELIKDLVYLYGFRPSDAKLAKIFVDVIRNSLMAYGVSATSSQVVSKIGGATKAIPILGGVISTVVDSSVQGLVNGTLTMIIGRQVTKYLYTEYKLQDILDGVEIVETQEEFDEACKYLKKELKKEQRDTDKKLAGVS